MSERARQYLAERKQNKEKTMNTPEENAAIATCNSWLNVVGLPTYTQLQERIAELEDVLRKLTAAADATVETIHQQLAAPVAAQEPQELSMSMFATRADLEKARAAQEAPPAPSERQPVAWTLWMKFDNGLKPTDPVLFSEAEAKRQQAIYGGEIVPLYRV
jgi:hypothetical protein